MRLAFSPLRISSCLRADCIWGIFNKRHTALVTQSVQVGSTLGHFVDVIPHDPDGRIDLGLQSCGLRNSFGPSYSIQREGFDQER